MPQNGFHIGQLAKRLATSTKTLRFYESIGLLRPPGRSASDYRIYDHATMARAQLVIDLRRMGLTIGDLQELFRPENADQMRSRLLGLIDEKLREMYMQLGVLQGRTDDLSARHAALLATPRSRAPGCVCDALLRPCRCA